MYKDSSLGPYNEVAITFPVQQKTKNKINRIHFKPPG
jgi:hypothetical protein